MPSSFMLIGFKEIKYFPENYKGMQLKVKDKPKYFISVFGSENTLCSVK
jgi:hypothetical protein